MTDDAPVTADGGIVVSVPQVVSTPHPLDVRPCACCAAYVPADTGCAHWRPQQHLLKDKTARQMAAKRERDRVKAAARRAKARAELDAYRAAALGPAFKIGER